MNGIRQGSWEQFQIPMRLRLLGSLFEVRDAVRLISCVLLAVVVAHVIAGLAPRRRTRAMIAILINRTPRLVPSSGLRADASLVSPSIQRTRTKRTRLATAAVCSEVSMAARAGRETCDRTAASGPTAAALAMASPRLPTSRLIRRIRRRLCSSLTTMNALWRRLARGSGIPTNGGAQWQRATNAAPPCTLSGVVMHVRFSPFTEGVVYASSPCRGCSIDHGKSWSWISPVLSNVDAVIDGLDIAPDVSGIDRVVFCARDLGVGRIGLVDSFALSFTPFPAGAPVGNNCSVAFDPTNTDRVFVATHNGGTSATSAVYEGRAMGGDVSLLVWRPLVAPSSSNGRPVLVQVHREGNGIRVYYHDSALLWAEDCASSMPCPQGSSTARPATCPSSGWTCVDMWHADVTAIAFDPTQPTKACPLLLASDGGIARDPTGGCFSVPSGTTVGGAGISYDAVASNAGLHALLSFSATVSKSSSGTQRFGIALWITGSTGR